VNRGVAHHTPCLLPLARLELWLESHNQSAAPAIQPLNTGCSKRSEINDASATIRQTAPAAGTRCVRWEALSGTSRGSARAVVNCP